MPKKEDYLECPVCSKEFGHEALYPRKALKNDEDLFEGKVLRCPRGHKIEAE